MEPAWPLWSFSSAVQLVKVYSGLHLLTSSVPLATSWSDLPQGRTARPRLLWSSPCSLCFSTHNRSNSGFGFGATPCTCFRTHDVRFVDNVVVMCAMLCTRVSPPEHSTRYGFPELLQSLLNALVGDFLWSVLGPVTCMRWLCTKGSPPVHSSRIRCSSSPC